MGTLLANVFQLFINALMRPAMIRFLSLCQEDRERHALLSSLLNQLTMMIYMAKTLKLKTWARVPWRAYRHVIYSQNAIKDICAIQYSVFKVVSIGLEQPAWLSQCPTSKECHGLYVIRNMLRLDSALKAKGA